MKYEREHMEYPKCQSCGHEIYEKNPQTCQFCGAQIKKTPVSIHPKSVKRNRMIVLAGVVIVLFSGIFVSIMVSDIADQSIVSEKPIDTIETEDVEICIQQLNEIIRKQEKYYAVNGIYADSKEFQRAYPDIDTHCPSSGDLYDVSIQDFTITIQCPVHYSMEVRGQ